MGLNFYTGYVFKTYGVMKRGNHNHSNHTSFNIMIDTISKNKYRVG